MPDYKTYTEIENALKNFNKRAYNAALGFKVYTSDAECLYIQASFNFAYYVNVDIECREVIYTNIDENASWPDAWNTDQIFLLSRDELEDIIDFKEIEINTDKPYFGIVFNIIGKENYFKNGTAICTELYINWRFPAREDS